jgi:voltage-gated potassium channel
MNLHIPYPHPTPWRARAFEIIFESRTPPGKLFDVILLWAIFLSVIAVLVDSVSALRPDYGFALRVAEWVFTILFTVEYIFRWLSVKHPRDYALSFSG